LARLNLAFAVKAKNTQKITGILSGRGIILPTACFNLRNGEFIRRFYNVGVRLKTLFLNFNRNMTWQLFNFFQFQIYAVGDKKHLFDHLPAVENKFDLPVSVVGVKELGF